MNQINEANDFYEEMKSQKQAVVNWRNGPPDPAAVAGAAALQDALDDDTVHAPLGGSAHGQGKAEFPPTTAGQMTADGIISPNRRAPAATPNG